MARVIYHSSMSANAPYSLTFSVDDRNYLLESSGSVEIPDEDVVFLKENNYIFREGVEADMIVISDFTLPSPPVEPPVEPTVEPTTTRRVKTPPSAE